MCDLIDHLRGTVRSAALVALALGVLCWPGAGQQVAAQTAAASKDTAKNAKTTRASSGEQGIIALVNDEPITAYAVEQRARFLALNANIGEQAKENFQRLVKSESTNAQFRALQEQVLREHRGKSREEILAIFQEKQKQLGMELQKQAVDSARAVMLPRLRKEAKEELIDERLKIQAAKKLGIEVTDADLNTILKSLAERNKMTNEQFAQHMKGMGVDVTTLSERFRAQKAWRDLIAKRYAAQVSVTQRDVDRMISSSAIESGDDTTELQLQKITLALPSQIDQAALIKRYSEAEVLRRKFRNCTTMADLAKSVSEARFTDMKFVKPAAIPEPTRTMLLGAKEGDMLPPATTVSGVEVYALCGRRAVAGNEAARTKALQELQSKELDVLARRHMRNLRQEADIEHR
jgi:peptidyl-prolyl cis-trans isomerase SurA